MNPSLPTIRLVFTVGSADSTAAPVAFLRAGSRSILIWEYNFQAR